MKPATAKAIKKHFRSWSGGFPPESDYQIYVYIDAARLENNNVSDDELREMLREWMCNPDSNDFNPYP